MKKKIFLAALMTAFCPSEVAVKPCQAKASHKKITAHIKLRILAGKASPAPPIGPALGQHGVNIMEFCKAFNARTQSLVKGVPIPVHITVYGDHSFTFEIDKTASLRSNHGRVKRK